MHAGVIYPQVELRGDPDAVRRLGDASERLGYTHLLAYDHVLGAVHDERDPPMWGPYNEKDPFHDPFVLFAYLAGRTESLGFVTGVLVLPQRQTALVAKQAADLSLLAGKAPDGTARFRLGVGVGWNPVEYDGLGQDFSTRGARLEEQVPLLRQLWTEPVVSFAGRFDRIDRAATIPRPSEPIPIWLGGWVDAALRRAVQIGDGFIFAGAPSGLIDQLTRLQSLLQDQGRSTGQFGAEAMVTGHADPIDAVRFVERWDELGGTHAAICTMGLGFDSIDAHLDYFEAVAEGLRARLPGSTRDAR